MREVSRVDSEERAEQVTEDHEEQLALTLTNEQREAARKILEHVSGEVERISKGDPDVTFRMRRYIHARLQLKNRGTPQQREKLRKRLFDKQKGSCAFCRKPFEQLSGTNLHRTGPARYTEANTVLVHQVCHEDHHRGAGEAAETE